VLEEEGALFMVDLAGVGFGKTLVEDLADGFLDTGTAGGLF